MKSLSNYYNCSNLNMILELTNACNLRCRYCFENYQTEQRDISIMTKNILEKAIRFLLKDRRNCHLTFFGGEPTLCKELIIHGIYYGNQLAREQRKYISYSIVTNGTNIDDEFLNILNENNVNIVYSFDGNKFVQNQNRPFAGGKGSYEVVYKNLIKILNSRKDERYGHIIVRPTITSESVRLMNNIYNEFINIGCKEVSFSLVSADENKQYAIREKDIEILRESYKEMTKNYYYEIEKGNSFNKFFESILKKVDSDSINKYFCDCGRRYIAIGTNGDIYPCEGFLGVKQAKLGNINNEFLEKEWILPQSVEVNKECNNCWAKYLCGGSCYHEAWMRTGSINGRDKLVCETYKLALEYALKLYVRLKEQNIKISENIKETLILEKSVPVIEKSKVKEITSQYIYISDGNNHRMITLNETAKRVLELCNGDNNISKISRIIENEYECKNDNYRDISNIINNFLENGLLYLTI